MSIRSTVVPSITTFLVQGLVLGLSVLWIGPRLGQADEPTPSTLGLPPQWLSRPILGPTQTQGEALDLSDGAIPAMPMVATRTHWQARADEIRKDVLDRIVFRGRAAAWRDAPTQVEWQDTIAGGPGYKIKKLRYEALPGLWIPALLYEPDKLEGKVAVSLNVNGHDAMGKAVDYKQIRCINMAKRGMLALNVEWLNMGQLRGDGYNHYLMNQLDLCGASGLAPFYLAMRRGLDLLLKHPNADPSRVLVTGLSGGGWQTILLSALDTRVTMSVPVAGYSSFKTRAAKAADLGDSEQTPNDLATIADYAHLTAMLAPRPTLLVFNAKDNCCFRAADALPPLLAAATPIFELFEAKDHLRSHVNQEPGDHNYGRDNREAMYRMLRDFFHVGDGIEIECSKELKTAEELAVKLPEVNLDFRRIAIDLARDLPRKTPLPQDQSGLRLWRTRWAAKLKEVLRAGEFSTDATAAWTLDDAEKSIQAAAWKIKVGSTWTVPVLVLERKGSAPTGTTLMIGEGTRAELSSRATALLEAGRRVVLADLFYFGESKILQRDFLVALLLSTVGERPLGIQVSELAAVARWARRNYGDQPVEIEASGPRVGVIALAAAVLEEQAIAAVTLRRPLGSLKQLIETGQDVTKSPELFCHSLLESFDVVTLATLVAPRPITVIDASKRAQDEFQSIQTWYQDRGGRLTISSQAP